MSHSELLAEVNAYYSRKVKEFGPTPRGVDWNSVESQEIRFTQLLKIVDVDAPYVLGDFGCGYGALSDYVKPRFPACSYRGFDISEAMLEEARRLREVDARVGFSSDETFLNGCDYIVASGIFNVRLSTPGDEWKSYIVETIDRLAYLATRGFAFNCLTSYSDADRMRADLHYADPCELFDYCKRRFSRNVALLHDYRLYEFTLLVRLD